MFRWLVISCLLGGSVAHAEDANGDGCDDARFAAESSCVHPSAAVAPDVVLGTGVAIGQSAQVGAGTVIGDGAIIADFANIAGRNMAGETSVIGANAVVGRRSQLGSGTVLADQSIVGRFVTTGTDVHIGADAWVGYGSVLGDDAEVGANAVVGNRSSIGSWATIGANSVIARGVVVRSGKADNERTTIHGVVGPEARVGASALVAQGAYVRQQAEIGDGARILARARVGRNANIGPRTTVSEDAVVRGDANVCNDTEVPADTYIPRFAAFPEVGCPCEPGYAETGVIGVCDDVDECAAGTDDCGSFTDCVNTQGSYNCQCQLGYVMDVNGVCTAIEADVVGDFGPDLAHQQPSSILTSPSTVFVDGFVGNIDVDVNTTGSGSAAVVQAFRNESWEDVTQVEPGEEIRLVVDAPPGTGQSRSVTVTLFIGPTTVWTSQPWNLSTWTYSATGISYGGCSASCGGGSQSPISWSCRRSDGTNGHSSSNCSAGGARSCNTQSCPFPSGGQVYTSGDRTRINDPNTNSPRYEIQCRNGGNGGQSVYTVVSPASTTVNSSSREITIFLYNGGTTRRGYVKFRFNATSSGLSVSSFQPGAGSHHPYLCYNPSFNESACNIRSSIIDPNCSSRIFCRMRDMWAGGTMWSNSLNTTRAIPCNGFGGGPTPPSWNSW